MKRSGKIKIYKEVLAALEEDEPAAAATSVAVSVSCKVTGSDLTWARNEAGYSHSNRPQHFYLDQVI